MDYRYIGLEGQLKYSKQSEGCLSSTIYKINLRYKKIKNNLMGIHLNKKKCILIHNFNYLEVFVD